MLGDDVSMSEVSEMGTKYRLWVVDKTTNEVFHLDFESKEDGEWVG